MTVTFLGEKVVVPFDITSQRTRFRSDTVRLRRRSTKLSGHRWAVSFMVVPNIPEEFLVDFAALDLDTVFDLALEPFPRSPIPKPGSAIDTIGAKAAGATEVAISAAGNRLRKGCWIRFSNHDKLYKVQSVTAGSSATTIFPELDKAVPNDTRVHYWNTANSADREAIHMTCLLDIDDDPGLAYSDGLIAQLGPIRAIEAV